MFEDRIQNVYTYVYKVIRVCWVTLHSWSELYSANITSSQELLKLFNFSVLLSLLLSLYLAITITVLFFNVEACSIICVKLLFKLVTFICVRLLFKKLVKFSSFTFLLFTRCCVWNEREILYFFIFFSIHSYNAYFC